MIYVCKYTSEEVHWDVKVLEDKYIAEEFKLCYVCYPLLETDHFVDKLSI